MEPLFLGLCFTMLLGFSQELNYNKFPLRSKHRRSYHENFMEEKLIEQGQALEQLLKIVQKNEDLTRKLLEHLMSKVDQPKLPEKVDATVVTSVAARRNFETTTLHPVLEFASMLPKYGNLLKSWALGRLDEQDPIALIEER